MGPKQSRKINFKSSCPPNCICNGTEVHDWHHANDQGDISCEKGQCGKYFIQHTGFKCKESENYQQFTKVSQFLMALAAANQSAEYNLSDRDLVNFISTLNTNVVKRWSN